MAKLTDEQKKQLAELRALEEAPDERSHDDSVRRHIHIDLSDKEAIKEARKMGLLSYIEGEESESESESEGDDEGGEREVKKEKGPRRNGYFGS